MQHALLVEQRQARGGDAPDHVGLRIALLGEQLGSDDACRVADPLDLDVRLDLVEGLLVGLELVGLERRVDGELRLLRQGCRRDRDESRGEQCPDYSLIHAELPVGLDVDRRKSGPVL
jgi:hypothetical protein